MRGNLEGQYGAVRGQEERERRLKEELHRINTTAAELAIDLTQERNANKQLQAQLANSQTTVQQLEKQLKQLAG